MASSLNILLVEDNPADAQYVNIQLEEVFGTGFKLEVREYFSKAMEVLKNAKFDVIILDLSLPDSNGLTQFKELLSVYKTPAIIYTGMDNETVRSEAMNCGACDYLIKDRTTPADLKRAVIKCVGQK